MQTYGDNGSSNTITEADLLRLLGVSNENDIESLRVQYALEGNTTLYPKLVLELYRQQKNPNNIVDIPAPRRSGKSTAGIQLAEKLRAPIICKDYRQAHLLRRCSCTVEVYTTVAAGSWALRGRQLSFVVFDEIPPQPHADFYSAIDPFGIKIHLYTP
jgi:hypothetical protein